MHYEAIAVVGLRERGSTVSAVGAGTEEAQRYQADHQLDRYETHARPFGRVYDGQQESAEETAAFFKKNFGEKTAAFLKKNPAMAFQTPDSSRASTRSTGCGSPSRSTWAHTM